MASPKKSECTPEEWAAFLKQRRDKRAAQKTHQKAWDKAAKAADAPEPSAPESSPSALEVDVEELAPAPPSSLRERMAKRLKSAVGVGEPKTASKSKAKKVDVNFLTKALPLISGVAASYASTWFAEEYKACAPRREEVVGILSPIFAMIERRVEVTGKMSEDAMDLMASGMATLGFVGRSYVTFVDIKQTKGTNNGQSQKSPSSAVERADTEPDAEARESALVRTFGRGDPQGAFSGDSGNLVRQSPGDNHELPAFHDVEVSGRDVLADDGTDKSRELATVAFAFRRDAQYRSANGLL